MKIYIGVFLVATLFLFISCKKEEGTKVNLPAESASAKEIQPSVPVKNEESSEKVEITPKPEVEKATKLETDQTYTGTTEPHRKSMLSSKVTGLISKVHVKEGEKVRKEQLLVSLDDNNFKLYVAQAEAALEGAKLQVEAIRTEWNRIKTLVEDKAIPRNQFDAVDFKLKGADISVKQAEIALNLARSNLKDTQVVAPFSGLITLRMVQEGEYATAMPPKNLFIIEEVDTLDLRVQLPSKEISMVKIGDPLKIYFSDLDKKVTSKITRIISSVDPRTRTFSIISELENGRGTIKPGLFATVEFIKKR